MKLRFAMPAFVAAIASLALSACGNGTTPGSSTLPPTALQSAVRAPAAVTNAAATPTPNPCSCPPIPHHMCSDIACMSANSTHALQAVSAATPKPTPVPPCYCPPGHHACPDCTVSQARIPNAGVVAEARDRKDGSLGRFRAG